MIRNRALVAGLCVGVLSVHAAAQPANDLCAGAIDLSAGPFPVLTAVVDITNATTTNDPVFTCQATRSRTVWYKVTPVIAGNMRVSTCAADAPLNTVGDTVIAVYTGNCAANSWVQIGCSDDACSLRSNLTVPVMGGTEYYILAGKFGTGAPTATAKDLQLFVNAPTNAPTPPTGSGAVSPTSVTNCGDQSVLVSVLVTPGANPPSTGIQVMANLASIGGNSSQALNDAGLNGDVTAGDGRYSFSQVVANSTTSGPKTFGFIVGDAQGRSSMSSITGLTVTQCPPPPLPNETCAAAVDLTQGQNVIGYTTSLGTTSTVPACGSMSSGKMVWYRVIGTGNTMTATTCDPATNHDTVVGVCCGAFGCASLGCIGANDDAGSTACPTLSTASIFSWCSVQGAPYYVAVRGFSTNIGNFGLTVTDSGTPCANPINCSPQPPVVDADLGDVNCSISNSILFNLSSGQVRWLRFNLTGPAVAANMRYFDIDTNGSAISSNDTIIGLFNAAGGLVASDDDDGPALLSVLSFGTGSGSNGAVGQDGDLPAGVYYLAAGAYNITFANGWVASPNGTATGSLNHNLTCGDTPIIVTGFTPPTAGIDDIVTITGRGFGNNPDNICAVVAQPTGDVVPLRALTANGDTMTALVRAVREGAVPGPIMVARGTGSTGSFTPLFKDVIPEDPHGVWVWCGRGFPPPGASQNSIIPIPTPPPQPPPPNEPVTNYYYGQIAPDGALCLILHGRWMNNTYIRVIVHIVTPAGARDDVDLGCIRIRLGGSALDCARRICDMIRCVIAQRLPGVFVDCQVIPLPNGDAKIVLRSLIGPGGPPSPVTIGGLDLCVRMPRKRPVPTPNPDIPLASPFFAADVASDPLGLRALNIGSSGNDGVTIALNNAPNLEVQLLPLDLPQGGRLSVQGWGSLGGVPEQRLGLATAYRVDSFFDVFADFSDIGAPQQRIRVFDGPDMVLETVVPNGVAGRVLPVVPGGILRPGGCGKFGPPIPCYWIDWDQRVIFNVPGSAAVQGTRYAMLAEGGTQPIDYLEAFDISAAMPPGQTFVVTNAIINTGGRCIADYNSDGGVDGADVQAFFDDWELGLPAADVNEDGGVDGSDVGTFFAAWELGSC